MLQCAIAATPGLDYSKRAVAKKDTHSIDDIIADCNRALKLDPKDAKAYFTRGVAKQASRDIDGAIGRLQPRIGA